MDQLKSQMLSAMDQEGTFYAMKLNLKSRIMQIM